MRFILDKILVAVGLCLVISCAVPLCHSYIALRSGRLEGGLLLALFTLALLVGGCLLVILGDREVINGTS